MVKLWQKSDTALNPVVERYTVGTDYLFDMELLPFDIAASKVHARGLEKIGILTTDELSGILNALDSLAKDHQEGNVVITPEMEDCHTMIEDRKRSCRERV